MPQGEERRKHIRIFLPGGQVRLVSGILLVLVGKVIDISLGGVKFVCSPEFSSGDEIGMDLTLPNGLKLKCTAKICYREDRDNNQNEAVYGAQFVNLGTSEQAELGEFIMKQRAEQDGFLNKKLN
jgi:c-di-GMP-binding flagellar brake protein YcgR